MMLTTPRLLAAGALLCWTTLAVAVPPAPAAGEAARFAAQWPAQGRAVFEVRHGGSGVVVGRSEHRWQHDGQRWSLHATTAPAGLAALFSQARATQESRGVFVAGGLQPLEFLTERNGQPKDSARFDLASGSIELGNGERAPLSGRTQDLLSLFYQLGAEDLARPRFVITLTTGRKLADYEVTVRATQTLQTGSGTHRVHHLQIVAAAGAQSGESTEIWLDTTHRLPVKIRHRDRNGGVFDQTLVSLEIGNQK